ncbi:hypothetical protein IJG20_01300 [Candidatus Saccharibacteria bacterium]|nr:hypothetical protein [Candidatus Saccharibacteria bacterium]
MSAFFIKKPLLSPFSFGKTPKKNSRFVSFPNPTEFTSVDERPFWEIQRAEALEVLTNLYNHWRNSWNNTKASLGDLNLSSSLRSRINFYEAEQQKAILSLLSKILVAWEKYDEVAFSENILALAKEFRPSYAYLENDPEEGASFQLTESQLSILRNFISTEATVLKDSVRELQLMSWKKIDFGDNTLTESAAEALLRERLGLIYFDFVEGNETPEFSSGYYPALLQDLTDQGL